MLENKKFKYYTSARNFLSAPKIKRARTKFTYKMREREREREMVSTLKAFSG